MSKKGFVIFIIILLIQSCGFTSISQKEKDLLVTAKDFEAGNFSLPENYAEQEKMNKIMLFDGSYMINYEYNCKNKLSEILYIQERISVEKSVNEQKALGKMETALFDTVFGINKLKFKEQPELSKHVKYSKIFTILNEDDFAVGNCLIANKNLVRFTFILIGIPVDDPVVWEELFNKKIEEIVLLK